MMRRFYNSRKQALLAHSLHGLINHMDGADLHPCAMMSARTLLPSPPKHPACKAQSYRAYLSAST